MIKLFEQLIEAFYGRHDVLKQKEEEKLHSISVKVDKMSECGDGFERKMESSARMIEQCSEQKIDENS